MIEWIFNNKEWVFSGVGVIFIMGMVKLVLGRKNIQAAQTSNTQPISVTNHNILNMGASLGAGSNNLMVNPNSLKATTHILFIDDDQKFKVVDILKKSGWNYTRRASDVGSIDDPMVQQANILFIDIQGVGRRLQFKDEGLGLALAIKDKYPAKKVVIYSAQTQGERFHDALRKADDCLPKNADPYEFQQLTERLATEIQRES